MQNAIQLFPQGVRDQGGEDTNTWILLEKSLELIIRGNQHDFIRLAGALVACVRFSVHAGLDYFLRGLHGVLLIGRGEVVDGVLYHVSWVYGLLQTAGDALHRRDGLCTNKDMKRFTIRHPYMTPQYLIYNHIKQKCSKSSHSRSQSNKLFYKFTEKMIKWLIKLILYRRITYIL